MRGGFVDDPAERAQLTLLAGQAHRRNAEDHQVDGPCGDHCHARLIGKANDSHVEELMA